jgi:hypothetical protein
LEKNCFVHLLISSAFDTVWRIGLWQKMQKFNVQGKICKVINCMYQNIKTCIRKENEYSEFFNCEIGVKQGIICPLFVVVVSK